MTSRRFVSNLGLIERMPTYQQFRPGDGKAAPWDAPSPRPLVFLAGPIQGTWDWQAVATSLLLPHMNVANPRRDQWSDDGDYEEQVAWETEFLEYASYKTILFWLAEETHVLPGRTYAQTTRFELGEHFGSVISGKAIVGADPEFHGLKYIRTRYKQYTGNELVIHDTIEKACAAVVAAQ